MLVVNGISANEGVLYLLDVATGKLEQLNVKDKKAETIAYNSARFTTDGKGAYIVSDEGSEFATLQYYDFQKKSFTPITAAVKWDVQRMEVNEQGTQIAFVTNEDGYSRLYLLNTSSNKYEEVKDLPKGVIGNIEFHPDGSKLALSLTTSVRPSDVYVLHLESRQLERWTFSETGGLNPSSFTEPELVRYPTFDKEGKQARQIPAFIYRPKNAAGKVPVLINIHGGPEGQSTANFSSSIQYLVNELGIAVVVPNVRGSSGYGKSYLKLDNGFLRENSVKDIGSLLDWIAKQPNLDAGRVAVMGGSYGGYMTLACMTNYNDRLKAGIDVVGISNFVTFLKNTSDYRRDLRRVEYGDERDAKMEAHLQKISPNNNVKKITKPMFIIQGKNDPRVPVTEAEQMVEALKKNGNPTWYLMAKDEGHGFRKKSNRDFQNAATMLFLEQFVTGTDKGAAAPGSGK
jgi:dipeptidyl aminopeptidase/acylaminoacyl peptidase